MSIASGLAKAMKKAAGPNAKTAIKAIRESNEAAFKAIKNANNIAEQGVKDIRPISNFKFNTTKVRGPKLEDIELKKLEEAARILPNQESAKLGELIKQEREFKIGAKRMAEELNLQNIPQNNIQTEVDNAVAQVKKKSAANAALEKQRSNDSMFLPSNSTNEELEKLAASGKKKSVVNEKNRANKKIQQEADKKKYKELALEHGWIRPTVDNTKDPNSFIYKAASIGVGGGMVLSMFNNRGQQSNAQLYNQQRAY